MQFYKLILGIISSRGTVDLNLNLYLYSDNNPIMKKR